MIEMIHGISGGNIDPMMDIDLLEALKKREQALDEEEALLESQALEPKLDGPNDEREEHHHYHHHHGPYVYRRTPACCCCTIV